jgi:adenylate cyclase
MQLAMKEVNEQNRREDLPELEMGIGLHTGQVVLGNIGSPERMKYGVVGSQVNLTSRIQSYTTGGQILISESTRQAVAAILKLGKQMEVRAKGIEHPITLSEVLGIGGSHKLSLPEVVEALVPLADEIPFKYEVVEGAQLGGEMSKGGITRLSLKEAVVRLERAAPTLGNLNIHLFGRDGQQIPGTLYAKVLGPAPGEGARYSVRFTSVSADIEAFIRTVLEAGLNPIAPQRGADRSRSELTA